MFCKTNLFTIFFIVHMVNIWTCAFNLSPMPSLKIMDPQLKTAIKKTRSSYFGYTIVLREKSILIGAPRAQSTIPAQSRINETGAVYKCANSGKDPICRPFIFDRKGNEIAANDYLNSAMKSHQWLGASMAGGPKETDKLVVCAPGFAGGFDKMGNDPYMHGICFWTPDTLSDSPKKVTEIKALSYSRGLQGRDYNGNYKFFYQIGQQGFSVHITPNNNAFIFGAPGVDVWRGSVMRYDTINRDVKIPQISCKSQAYAGYAVASGYFDKVDKEKLLYVVSLPHGDLPGGDGASQLGEAFIFDYTGTHNINKYFRFVGLQYGEFFGYAVLAVDITGDGLDDILISGPLYSLDEMPDVGAVYVFLNEGNFMFRRRLFKSPFSTQGRFGTTMSSIGDINLDGFNDVAISAPFAYEYGAVAIYLGGPSGLRNRPSQIIKLNTDMYASYVNGMFGHGLSKGVDIDGNGYNDIAIGAPNAEAVFLYKSFPVVKIIPDIRNKTAQINVEEENLTIEFCYSFKTNSTIVKEVSMEINLEIDPKLRRANILDGENYKWTAIKTVYLEEVCTSIKATLKFAPRHVFDVIPIVLRYQLVKDGATYNGLEFCNDCVVLDPSEARMTSQFVRYIHGCKNAVCNVDMKVSSVNIPEIFIIENKKNTLFAKYVIRNEGEKAFDATAIVSSIPSLPFARVPSFCVENVENQENLICYLSKQQAFTDQIMLELAFDLETMEHTVDQLKIIVKAYSTGLEMTPNDNSIVNSIQLQRYAAIDIKGNSNETVIDCDKFEKMAKIFYEITLQNLGPNTVNDLQLRLKMPFAYRNEEQPKNFSFAQNFSLAIISQDKLYTIPSVESKVSLYTHPKGIPVDKLLQEEESKKLTLSCSGAVPSVCTEALLSIPLLSTDDAIIIELTYNLNIKVTKKMMGETFKYLNLLTEVELKPKTENSWKLNINTALEPTVIVYRRLEKTPLWIYIVSAIGGLLLLIILSTILFKMGFFKRQTKEEMEQRLIKKSEVARMKAEIDECDSTHENSDVCSE